MNIVIKEKNMNKQGIQEPLQLIFKEADSKKLTQCSENFTNPL